MIKFLKSLNPFATRFRVAEYPEHSSRWRFKVERSSINELWVWEVLESFDTACAAIEHMNDIIEKKTAPKFKVIAKGVL